MDTETTGLDWKSEPFAVSFSWAENPGTATLSAQSCYIETATLELMPPDLLLGLEELLLSAKILVFHNAKFDLRMLFQVFPYLKDYMLIESIWEDTDLMSRLVMSGKTHSFRLKSLAKDFLDLSTDENEILAAARRKLHLRKSDGYHLLPRRVVIPYALKDAEFTLQLWNFLSQRMDPELRPVYEMEKELTLALLDMESQGMRVDEQYAKRMYQDLGDEVLSLQMAIAGLAGKPLGKNSNKGEFNPNSNPQMLELFEREGHKIPNLQKETLSKLEGDLPQQTLTLKRLIKLHGTYFKNIIDETADGILHPNFKQAEADTGRMSSGKEA